MGRKLRNFFKTVLVILITAAIPGLLFMYAVQAKKNTDLLREIKQLEVKEAKLIEENNDEKR